MVLHEHDFKAQLFKDNLSFTTAPSTGMSFSFFYITFFFLITFEESPSSSPIKKGALFSGQQSPFTHRAFTTFNKTTLSFHDPGVFQLFRKINNCTKSFTKFQSIMLVTLRNNFLEFLQTLEVFLFWERILVLDLVLLLAIQSTHSQGGMMI
jgi:hypothetical protein